MPPAKFHGLIRVIVPQSCFGDSKADGASRKTSIPGILPTGPSSSLSVSCLLVTQKKQITTPQMLKLPGDHSLPLLALKTELPALAIQMLSKGQPGAKAMSLSPGSSPGS